MLREKKTAMIKKDNFAVIFLIFITGLIGFSSYKIGYMLTKDIGGGIGIGVNIAIWSMIGLTMYVLGDPPKRIWIWGVAIGVLLFIATQNVFILVIWCIFGYLYNKYANLKRRYTEYGTGVNYEMEYIESEINNYKSDVKDIFSSEEMNRYIGKIYPYMAAADMVYSMEKLADIIKENNYVSYDEVNNNFRNTYRHNTVKSYVLRSYNSSVNHHSATSGSGSSSHSSGGSSGGGHGGGGGGSW